MEEVDVWLKVIGSYGFPIAAVVMLSVLLVKGCRAVWTWLMPRIDKVIDAHMTFLQTLTQAMETLTSDGRNAHGQTHEKLDRIETRVIDIHKKVVQ